MIEENNKINLDYFHQINNNLNLKEFESFSEINTIKENFTNYKNNIEDWKNSYLELVNQTDKEKLKNLEFSKNLFLKLTNNEIIQKFDLESEIINLEKIKKLIELSEEMLKFHSYKTKSIEEKLDPEEVIKFYNSIESTGLDQQKLFHYEMIKEDLENYKKWLARYEEYIKNKKEKNFEKFQPDTLQNLINESNNLIVNVKNQVQILQNDLSKFSEFTYRVNILINKSNNFNNILNDENNLKEISELLSWVNNNNNENNNKILYMPNKQISISYGIETFSGSK
jgi:hypothetical protein